MRVVVTASVLLAVVATALVAVSQQSETRRLQHAVWQLERRHENLDRARQRLEAAVEAARTPRRLLDEHDRRPVEDIPAACDQEVCPAGFVTGGNFEAGGR